VVFYTATRKKLRKDNEKKERGAQAAEARKEKDGAHRVQKSSEFQSQMNRVKGVGGGRGAGESFARVTNKKPQLTMTTKPNSRRQSKTPFRPVTKRKTGKQPAEIECIGEWVGRGVAPSAMLPFGMYGDAAALVLPLTARVYAELNSSDEDSVAHASQDQESASPRTARGAARTVRVLRVSGRRVCMDSLLLPCFCPLVDGARYHDLHPPRRPLTRRLYRLLEGFHMCRL
jgi:hypothetical protein